MNDPRENAALDQSTVGNPIASMGGKASAAKLTAEERKDRARKAADARWGNTFRRATHEGDVMIGDICIPSAVLEDGTRVISQRGMSKALGRVVTGSGSSKSDKNKEKTGDAKLPSFLSARNLKPFIDNELTASLTSPIEYIPLHGGRSAYGFKAELVLDICDVWVKAKGEGVLLASQHQTADVARILMKALGRVGIIALVDEATGFQYERPRRQLEEYLKKFLSESLRKWVRTFPADYFKHLCRLRGIELRPDMKLPQYFGTITNNLVYRRMAPGLVTKLKERRVGLGRPNEKLHSGLSLDFGIPEVLVHLGTVVGVMKLNTDYKAFEKQLDEIAPIYPETPGLFDDPEDWNVPD